MKNKFTAVVFFIFFVSVSIVSAEDFKFSLFSTIEINADKDIKNIFGSLNTVSFCESLPGLDNLLKFGDISILPYIQFNLFKIEYVNSKSKLSVDKLNLLNSSINSKNAVSDKNYAVIINEFNSLKNELARNLNAIYSSKTSQFSPWLNLKNEKIRAIYTQLNDLRYRMSDIVSNHENIANSALADVSENIEEILAQLEQFGDNWNFDYFCGLLAGVNIEIDITNLRKFRNHNQTLFIGAETSLTDYTRINNSVKIGFKIKDLSYSDKIYGFKFNNVFSGRENFSYGVFGGSQIFKY